MRASAYTLSQRLCVQLGMVAAGSLPIYAFPHVLLQGNAGNGFKGTKWVTFFTLATMATTGAFGLGWGILINGFAAAKLALQGNS